MALATVAQIRAISGLSITAISDEDLAVLIAMTDRMTRNALCIFRKDEVPEGSADGTRDTFKVHHPPVADLDLDGTEDDKDDVEARSFTKNATTNFYDVATLSVASVVSRTGVVGMTTAPSIDIDQLKYTYYEAPASFWERIEDVKLASSYLSAFYAAAQIMGVSVPNATSYRIGDFSVSNRYKDNPVYGTMKSMLSGYDSLLYSFPEFGGIGKA